MRRWRANSTAACTRWRCMRARRGSRVRRSSGDWPPSWIKSGTGLFGSCAGQIQRRIDEHPVLLRFRLLFVLAVDVLDRAFADQRTREDHDADEARRAVASLREYRVGAGF